MKRKYCFSLILYVFGCAFAQDYHAASIYEAVGPVKEIKTDSKNPFVKGKVKINRDGKSDNPMMMYDDSGYPVGFELNALGVHSFQKFFWDTENRLDSVSVQFPVFGKSTLLTVKNDFKEQTLDTQFMKVSKGDYVAEYKSTFSDYSYDGNGNWISRSVDQVMTDANGCISSETFIETRKIKYYDPYKEK